MEKIGTPNTLDSRDVAKMVDKTHGNLVRDIGSYIDYMAASTEIKIDSSDFFLESTYHDSTGRTLKCYSVTKKGCEMIANKLTGAKGIRFTAEYVTRFHAMEDRLALPPPVPTRPGIPTPTAYGEAILLNARTRQAALIAKLAEDKRLGSAVAEALTLEAAQAVLGRPVQLRQPIPALPEPPKVPVAYPPYPTPSRQPKTHRQLPPMELPKEPGERYYTASEIAGAAGRTSAAVGSTAKKYGLKTPEYGITKRIYNRFTGGEVDGFFYNERGRAKLLDLLKA